MDDHEQTGRPNQTDTSDQTDEIEVAGPELAPPAESLVDGKERHVDPRTVKVGRTVGFAVVLTLSVVPLTVSTIGWGVGGIPTPVYLGILGAWSLLLTSFLFLAYRWPAARYRHLLYQVERDGLRIRRGVFWRKVIWIPTTRVQHTDVSQGPLQRRFDLGTITVYTAGTEGASISLEGLEHTLASHLSDHLRPAQATDAS